jgi:hypothetical protein
MADGEGAPAVLVVRSARRSRTASIRQAEGRLEVRVPAGLPPEVEKDLVDRLVARLRRRQARATAGSDLEARARRLSERYLEGRARPTSVCYVDNMRRRWGSATPATGAIRLSRVLADVPPWVSDYVLLHELCHLVVPDHSRAFRRLLGRYPRAERARGYLLALQRTQGA